MANECRAPSSAEALAARQCTALDSIFTRPLSPYVYGSSLATCTQMSELDLFMTSLSGEFELDDALRVRLARQLAVSDPDGAALLLVAGLPAEELPKDAQAAKSRFEKLLEESADSAVGKGNVLGNTAAVTESVLLAAFERQAKAGFEALLKGTTESSVKLGEYITVISHKIGKGGVLRQGSRLKVRIKNLPLSVIQQLPSPVIVQSKRSVGTMSLAAQNTSKMQSAAGAVAQARVKSSILLRSATSKTGAGILTFAPSAAFDLYDSSRWTDDGLEVNWKGFAVASAKSQSGNALGMAVGAAAGAGAVALGVVAAAGAPVILIGLAAGIVAQVAWGYFDGDEAAAEAVEGWLN